MNYLVSCITCELNPIGGLLNEEEDFNWFVQILYVNIQKPFLCGVDALLENRILMPMATFLLKAPLLVCDVVYQVRPLTGEFHLFNICIYIQICMFYVFCFVFCIYSVYFFFIYFVFCPCTLLFTTVLFLQKYPGLSLPIRFSDQLYWLPFLTGAVQSSQSIPVNLARRLF